MIKKYVHLVVLFSLMAVSFGYSQKVESQVFMQDPIQGLSLYPNPVNNGKLYIYTSKNLSKHVEVFDVLGKKVLSTSIYGKTLDVSSLNSGVYIIKIEEGATTSTKKFVIR